MIADRQRWPSFFDNFRADFIGKGVQGVGTASVQYGAWSPAGIHTYGPSGAALRVARVGKSQLLTTVAVTRLCVALRVSLPGLQSRRGVKGSSKRKTAPKSPPKKCPQKKKSKQNDAKDGKKKKQKVRDFVIDGLTGAWAMRKDKVVCEIK